MAMSQLFHVSTRKIGDKIEIRVKDNGNGIPQKYWTKYFSHSLPPNQPVREQDLGLSLSYDIVKAHGGEISVDTREGEFTEFVVQIPAG